MNEDLITITGPVWFWLMLLGFMLMSMIIDAILIYTRWRVGRLVKKFNEGRDPDEQIDPA